ncbi:hypothetical protein [Acinetobacter colistiniresistens]|uniref:hypothetical protein n=1 Tax=Acinetobacter colistiniresistens TaxID=280145 RepID=UPI0012508942|nr:hypothetical protein [Acinetobacter colistiniresistens]
MQQPEQNTIEKKHIAHVDIHELFFAISISIGFTMEDIEDYEDEIAALVQRWEDQGYIEIYTEDKDRKYGRAKEMASVRNSVPYYLGMYHARVLKGENDPLLVVTFDDVEMEGASVTVATVRFMAIHDDLFGPQGKGSPKFNDDQMRAIRKKIDGYRQQGDAYTAAQKLKENDAD